LRAQTNEKGEILYQVGEKLIYANSYEEASRKAVETGVGNAPRGTFPEQELREALLTAQDTIGKLIAQRDELLGAVMGLRRSWIAPHRYSLKAAEEKLMSVSDAMAPDYKFNS
jgi:hypothetical protein